MKGWHFAVGSCLIAGRVFAVEPIPSFYDDPGISRNRDYVEQHASERVDPFTGKLQLHYVDLFIPGNGGLDIKVQRSYNSLDRFLERVEPTVVGVGWTMHFGRVVRGIFQACSTTEVPALAPVLELPDGSRQILYVAPDGLQWLSTNRWRATCGPSGLLQVFSPDGTRYDMDFIGPVIGKQNSWYATQITDRNGNSLTLSYQLFGGRVGVSSIVASDGRAVTFNYDTRGRLASVTDGIRTWQYRFVESAQAGPSFPFLAAVERPDGAAWLYDYYLDAPGNDPGSHSLRRLTYPTGGSFSYKYGFELFNSSLPKTTVVDSKTDSDGLSWQFTYTPAVRRCTFDAATRSCAFPDGSFDVTNVIHPDGVVHQFAHIGANSVQPGMIYAIGLPLWSAVDVSGGAATEVTSYRWGASQKLSNVLNVRPAGLPTELFDGGIYSPQLAQRVVNRNGQIYANSYSDYDAFGNAQTVTESGPDGSGGTQSRTTSITYFVDPNRWIIHLPQDEATTGVGSITRSFDVNGNLRSESRYGVTTTFTYRADGEIETKTDARGAVSTITYQNYKRGIPQREEHPEGVIVTRVVSDAGNVVSETDGELAEVRYGYDGLNRITLIQHPLGAAVNVDWTPNQRVVSRDNYQQVTRFDGFARMASVEHRDLATSQAIVQTYRYDSYGRQTFASYPNDLKGTRTSYEPLGRAYLVEHASPVVGPSAASNRKLFTANRVRVTNERGFVTTLVHRAWGDPGKPELVEIQTPDPAATTRIARNGVGQPTSVTQDGKTRVFRYDTRFFLRESEEPETGLTLYGRDEIGNLKSRQVGTTPATTFGYDGRGRLKTIDYPVGTPSVTKTYYLDDKPKAVATTSAVREYFYDANKNLRREVLTIPDAGKSLTAEYRYDNKDAVAALVFGSGRQLLYAPDAFGRPTQIAPYVTRVEHYPGGTVARMVYGNGVETTTTLNDRLWPELVSATRGPLRISELRYGYDRIGNVSTVADAGDSGASRVLEYDPLDRLSSVGRQSLSGFVTYDGRGNIRSNLSSLRNGNAQSIDYIYDPVNDRLSRIDILNIGVGVGGGLPTQPIQVNFEYDSYGNVTRKGSSAFSYDDARQLKCSDCGTAQETVHAYDGLGMRVSSRTGGRTTYFMYGQSGQLLWEESATGEVKEYVYAGRRQIATRSARP